MVNSFVHDRTELCVLILQYNSSDLTLQLLESLVEHESGNLDRYNVIVMDNASDQPMKDEICSKFGFVTFEQYDENYGFAVAHNKIFSRIREEWVLLLNNDCILLNDAISRTLQATKNLGMDFSTCSLYNQDRTNQINFAPYPSPLGRILVNYTGFNRMVLEPWRLWRPLSRVGYINGAFLMLKREAVPPPQLFYEKYFMYGEDLDLMIRMGIGKRRGVRIKSGKCIHLGGASAKRKWGDGERKSIKRERLIDCFRRYFPSWQVRFFEITSALLGR